MSQPRPCTRGLKEWAVVVEALGRGDQLLLLRKGGIEDVGGEFRLESDSFVLWPTYLHQAADWLRVEHAHRLDEVLAERRHPDDVPLRWHAAVAAVRFVPSREALASLAAEHVWSDDYLDMRWRYRPELPLYLLLLRVSRLAQPIVVRETTAQRGCRSWVELARPEPLEPAEPVLDDAVFAARVAATEALL